MNKYYYKVFKDEYDQLWITKTGSLLKPKIELFWNKESKWKFRTFQTGNCQFDIKYFNKEEDLEAYKLLYF